MVHDLNLSQRERFKLTKRVSHKREINASIKMSFNRLTIQSLQAARQRAAYTGLSGLDGVSDQALRGSVVDAVLSIGLVNRVFSYSQALTNELAARLNVSGFRILNIDDSNLSSFTGGTIRVRAQVLTDGYANASDAASVIGGAAAAIGYNVTNSGGVLVSSAPAISGALVPTTGASYDPSTVPDNKPSGDKNPFGDFFKNLTASPVTLAVILGAAVVLVIAAKK